MPYAHCSQIYHPLYNKVSDRIFLKLREQYGGECIPMKKTLRRILEIKKNGENVVVGFISDQQPKWNSIHHFSPFLNRETAVFTGTEVLAKKLGAMVYYARVTRPSRGHYHCEFIPMTHTPADYKDFDLTDLYMSMLEKDIRTNPHLWLWTHKRWRRTKEEWLRRQQEGK
jgi:KDO2-lipid IV(A) lauroyltransferase